MYCPRCKQDRPDNAFEYPVTICLICYGTCRGNYDLSLDQLRKKARKARIGRANANAVRAQELLALVQPDKIEQVIRCDNCLTEQPIESYMNETGELVHERCILCRDKEGLNETKTNPS